MITMSSGECPFQHLRVRKRRKKEFLIECETVDYMLTATYVLMLHVFDKFNHGVRSQGDQVPLHKGHRCAR